MNEVWNDNWRVAARVDGVWKRSPLVPRFSIRLSIWVSTQFCICVSMQGIRSKLKTATFFLLLCCQGTRPDLFRCRMEKAKMVSNCVAASSHFQLMVGSWGYACLRTVWLYSWECCLLTSCFLTAHRSHSNFNPTNFLQADLVKVYCQTRQWFLVAQFQENDQLINVL